MWMRKERTTTEAQMQARTHIFGTIEAIAIAATVCSCAVGPDFHPIAAPGVNGYTSKPLPAHSASADVIGGDSQTLQAGGDIPGQWWNLFHSVKLDQLVDEALKANPNDAAFRMLRLPSRDADVLLRHQRSPMALGCASRNGVRLGAPLSWLTN